MSFPVLALHAASARPEGGFFGCAKRSGVNHAGSSEDVGNDVVV